jgi:hypothetical protein
LFDSDSEDDDLFSGRDQKKKTIAAPPSTKTSQLTKTQESPLEPAKTLDPVSQASGTLLDPVKPVPDPVNHPVKPVSGPSNPVKPVSGPPNPVKPVSGPPNPDKPVSGPPNTVPPKSVWDTDDEDEVPDMFFDLKQQPPQKKADEGVKEKIRERSLFDDSDEEEDEDLFLNLKISSVTSSEREPTEVLGGGGLGRTAGKPIGGISMFGGLDPRAFIKKRSRYAYFSCLPNTKVQFMFYVFFL